MNKEPTFEGFGKIARFNRPIIITEKIDGTNAQIFITEDGDIFAGSRNRWITSASDNFGFARWVEGNRDELLKLGPGRHFGEWWGQGIQRGYGLDHKRFSLFNTHRWAGAEDRPECCYVVPVLRELPSPEPWAIEHIMDSLGLIGSYAAPGFMNPEGIVLFHTHSRQLFKVTLENDGIPKSLLETT